jgi:hypothetical protein
MESVPGATATGLALAVGNDAATNDGFLYPVAIAPGTDLIPNLRHYPGLPWLSAGKRVSYNRRD